MSGGEQILMLGKSIIAQSLMKLVQGTDRLSCADKTLVFVNKEVSAGTKGKENFMAFPSVRVVGKSAYPQAMDIAGGNADCAFAEQG